MQFGFSFGLLVVAKLVPERDEDSVSETIDVGTAANTNSKITQRLRRRERDGIKVLSALRGTRQTVGIRVSLDLVMPLHATSNRRVARSHRRRGSRR